MPKDKGCVVESESTDPKVLTCQFLGEGKQHTYLATECNIECSNCFTKICRHCVTKSHDKTKTAWVCISCKKAMIDGEERISEVKMKEKLKDVGHMHIPADATYLEIKEVYDSILKKRKYVCYIMRH